MARGNDVVTLDGGVDNVDISQLNDRPAQPASSTIPKIANTNNSLRLQRDGLWLDLEQVIFLSFVFCVYALKLKVVIPESAFRSPSFSP